MWDKLSNYIAENVSPVVVEMAKAAGHDVVYTHPYHSDLQPIELVWTNIKGEVGRYIVEIYILAQYDSNLKCFKIPFDTQSS